MRSKSSPTFIPLLFLILLLAAISVSRLLYPYDVGHFEACTWTPALLSARRENPYTFATREPYVMAPYRYAYYMLVGLGFRVLGLQFWFGRLLTLFSAADELRKVFTAMIIVSALDFVAGAVSPRHIYRCISFGMRHGRNGEQGQIE